MRPKNKHSEYFKNSTTNVNLKMHTLTVKNLDNFLNSKDHLDILPKIIRKNEKLIQGYPNSNHSSKSDFGLDEIEKFNLENLKTEKSIPFKPKKKLEELSLSSKIQFG